MSILAFCTRGIRSLTSHACSLVQDAEAPDTGGEGKGERGSRHVMERGPQCVWQPIFPHERGQREAGFLLLLTHLLAEGRHEAIPGNGHGGHLCGARDLDARKK